MKAFQNHRLLAASIFFVLTASPASQAQVFYENFDIAAIFFPRPGCNIGDFDGGPGTYPFPANWLKRNVDNRTPRPGSFVDEAWEVRDDFKFDVTQCAAFSNSYYSPAGAADDWTWTPAITLPVVSTNLSWRAVAYDVDFADGYEVRVMLASNGPPSGGTAVIGNQITNSTTIFSVAAEASAWTTHTVSLAAYSGQSVYIGFRNNSNDKYLLLIDDVKVIDGTPNLVALAPSFSSVYPRVVAGLPVISTLGVHAMNSGGSVLTNVFAAATIKRNGVAVGSPILSNPIATLPIGVDKPMIFPMGYTFNSPGVWTIEYQLTANETPSETSLLDNVIESNSTAIGGNELARHKLPATSILGIGSRDAGELGNQFEINSTTRFEGIRFAMSANPSAPDWSGRSLVANLRAFDAVTGMPADVLATTIPFLSTSEGGTYDAMFVGGAQILAPGSYVVTVIEPLGGPAMPLMMSTERFQAGTTWYIQPSTDEGWTNFEFFGSVYRVVPNISLLSNLSLFTNGFETAIPAQTASQLAESTRPTRNPKPTQFVPE